MKEWLSKISNYSVELSAYYEEMVTKPSGESADLSEIHNVQVLFSL